MNIVKPSVTILDHEPERPAYQSALFRFLSRYTPGCLDLVLHCYWYVTDSRYRMIIDLDRILRDKTHRIDLLPEPSGERGFVLSIDREAALYCVQDGNHFFYEGWSLSGPDLYEEGNPLVSDAIDDFYEARAAEEQKDGEKK